GSTEYLQKHGGTNTGFVKAVYHDALKRDVDPPALAQWVQALDRGTPRAAVAQAVLSSPEATQLQVQEADQQFLHRGADAGGMALATQALEHGVSEDLLTVGLVASAEFFALDK